MLGVGHPLLDDLKFIIMEKVKRTYSRHLHKNNSLMFTAITRPLKNEKF